MKKLCLFGSLALLAIGGATIGATSFSEPYAAIAETSEPTETTEEEPPVAPEEHETEETLYQKAWSLIENKVVPIVGGTSVVTIVSVAVSIFTAISKRKGDKKNHLELVAQTAVTNALSEKVAHLEALWEKRNEFETKMLNDYKETFAATVVNMEQCANYTKTLTEQMAVQARDVKEVKEMKHVVEASTILTAKALALSDVAVKSGIAKDAQHLIATIKGEGEPNGEEN